MSPCEAPDYESRLRRSSVIAASFGILMLLALVNRKLGWELLDMRTLDVLRLRDFNTLFILTPIGMVLAWEFLQTCGGQGSRLLSCCFMLSVFLLALGFGMHEPMLGMMVAGYGKIPEAGESISYFKEIPGHWLFFAGFVAMSLAICAAELRRPFERPIPGWTLGLSAFAGLATAISIFGNMVKDPRSGRDMGAVAISLLIVLALHWRKGFPSLARLPFTLLIYLGYGLGCASTFLYWALFP